MPQATPVPATIPDPDEDGGEEPDQFYERMFPALFGYAARRCPRHVAEDLTQEVMVRMFRLWSSIQSGTRDQYAMRAVRNAVNSWRRKASTVREESTGEIAEPRAPAFAESPVELVVTGAELAARAADLMSRYLTRGEADVLQLMAAGMEPREIAEVRGVKVETVRTMAASGRAKLRPLLHDQEGLR